MKLEINYREQKGRNTNKQRTNNMLVKKQSVNEEIKEKIGKYLKGLCFLCEFPVFVTK